MQEHPLFWHIASTKKEPPCSIIRRGDWKLIPFLKDDRIELFNTKEDLGEDHDLAAGNPEVAEALLRS